MSAPEPSQGLKVPRAILLVLTAAFALAALAWTLTSAAAMSTTFDEPHHVATGLVWWQFGTYRWWTENPPLPKILIAALPYFAGLRLPADPTGTDVKPWPAGIELLAGRADGAHLLALARLGNVWSLILTLLMTFALAGGRRRPLAAFIATALVATYPPLLGHAGLATTDAPAVATVLLFLWAFDRWMDRPSRRRAAVVGAALAAATLCKLTAPLFCAAGALGWLGGRRLVMGTWTAPLVRPSKPAARSVVREVLLQVALAAVAAFVLTWAGYRFSTGRLGDLPLADYIGMPVLPPLAARTAFWRWLCRLPLPMPELWHGLLFLRAHDHHGHTAFLFGRLSEHGFWNFYLVGLLLKSPLPFLVLISGGGAWWAWRASARVRRRPEGATTNGKPADGLRDADARTVGTALAAAGMLALSTVMSVNIGLRHLLGVVPVLAIFAGRTAAAWIEAQGTTPRRRAGAWAALGVLLACNLTIVARAQPELFAYFNPLAGREPGHALIDSDLDWGQDLDLLRRELRARGVPSIHYGLFAIVDSCDPRMPPMQLLEPGRPVGGWVVLSEQFYRSTLHFSVRRESCEPHAHYKFHADPGDAFDWLKGAPLTAMIGSSLRLYHLPER